VVSTSESYTSTVSGNVTLVADFDEGAPEEMPDADAVENSLKGGMLLGDGRGGNPASIGIR
jgi:hypothetical protein